MKTLILTLGLGILLFTSCKKNNPEPQVVEKTTTVTIHDTIWGAGNTYTVTVHDTVYISTTPIPLNGIWYCYKMESGGSSTPHSDWVFTFGNTTFTQALGTSGTYNYPITYYSGSVDIFFSTSPTTYYVTSINNGTEYKLTKTSGTVQSWYLRK